MVMRRSPPRSSIAVSAAFCHSHGTSAENRDSALAQTRLAGPVEGRSSKLTKVEYALYSFLPKLYFGPQEDLGDKVFREASLDNTMADPAIPSSPTVRILLVDDYEPWRRSVCSMLRKRGHWHIVAEVADGLEAVQKAQELHPDLILLDIGLPRLNGIEAARRIRGCVLQSKILFLSENRSWDIAEEALRTGADGYVVKSNAASELLPAIEAVLAGRQFVSVGLVRLSPVASADTHMKRRPHERVVPPVAEKAAVTHCHEAALYPDDTSLVEGFARFIGAALKSGNTALVIATPAHRVAILQRLSADALDVYAAIKQGRFTSLDVSDVLSTFMVNDLPDPVRFTKNAADLIAQAAAAAPGKKPLAACGECAPTLLAGGNAQATIQLEHLWDDVAKRHDVEILCGYLWSSFPWRGSSPVLERICAEHTRVCGWDPGRPSDFPR